jgi:hypothetical protein
VIYGVRGRRIRFLAAVSRHPAARPPSLVRKLRAVGLIGAKKRGGRRR